MRNAIILPDRPGIVLSPRRRTLGPWCGVMLIACSSWAIGAQASAEPTQSDLKLIAQTMAFLSKPPTGTLEVGIVYPDGPGSGRAEAERLAAAFGSGLDVGALTLRPRLLTMDEAIRDTGIPALLLTDAVLPQAAALARAIVGRGVLTVSLDPEAVTAGEAVMAVRSEPRVEIYVSRAAAAAAGVEFSTAFRMMIQER